MTDARLRSFWHRAGPLAAVATLLTAAAATEGCSSGTGNTGGTGGTGTTSTTNPTTSTMGTAGSGGGTGGSTPFGGKVTAAADATLPFDATPDPMGTTIYFTGVEASSRLGGVFKVPADGSAKTPVTVQAGDPFVAPFGISTSSDGKQLYVADPGALDPALTPMTYTSGLDHGVIFVLPVGGGTPTVISGTAKSGARSLEIVSEGGSDALYFTGRDPADGAVGVFKMKASGGAITAVAKGAPFLDPSGVAIAADGAVYVADTVGAGSGLASIVKIPKGGTPAVFLSDLRVGYPCGIALSKDDKTLFVSALDPATRTDRVLQVDVAAPTAMTALSMNIDTFTESAGLHRARNVDVFGWADSRAGMAGTVFAIK